MLGLNADGPATGRPSLYSTRKGIPVHRPVGEARLIVHVDLADPQRPGLLD
jgi:hypothetical protein